MNGGTRDDQDFTGAPPIPQLTDNDILLRAGQRAAGYRMKFLEIYEVDVNALPDATKAIHDLLTGAAGPPPPPQPSTVRKLRPILEIQDVNYRDDILFMIADLLKVDTRNGIAGISKDRLAAWSRSLGRHVFYSWRLWNWPEFTCMEERAFRPVFTGNFPNVKGDEVFYLGDAVLDVDGNPTGQVTGVGYYVKVESTADTLPTDPNSWSPFALDSGDFFIPLLQRCRRRFGQVTAVYPEDPRNDPLAIKHELDWIVSTRGLEVASSTPTVFVEYQAVPYKYAADLFVPNVSNPAGSLWLNTDGLVYRAIVKTNGNAIENNSQYALVPFPSAISNYCVYMTAADNAGDVATANDWRQVALSYLAREMDAKGNEMPLVQYDFGRRGLPHVILLSPLVADDTFPPAGATIDERCLTEWGDVIPI
jgi:hypothetical protein